MTIYHLFWPVVVTVFVSIAIIVIMVLSIRYWLLFMILLIFILLLHCYYWYLMMMIIRIVVLFHCWLYLIPIDTFHSFDLDDSHYFVLTWKWPIILLITIDCWYWWRVVRYWYDWLLIFPIRWLLLFSIDWWRYWYWFVLTEILNDLFDMKLLTIVSIIIDIPFLYWWYYFSIIWYIVDCSVSDTDDTLIHCMSLWWLSMTDHYLVFIQSHSLIRRCILLVSLEWPILLLFVLFDYCVVFIVIPVLFIHWHSLLHWVLLIVFILTLLFIPDDIGISIDDCYCDSVIDWWWWLIVIVIDWWWYYCIVTVWPYIVDNIIIMLCDPDIDTFYYDIIVIVGIRMTCLLMKWLLLYCIIVCCVHSIVLW